jgi:TP901 family phage tail tape measure protein
MNGFKRGMTEFNSGIQRAGGMFRNFTTGIVQGIGQAFGNASLRMIRDFGDSLTGTLRNAANMEQGIADIGSVIGATADQTKALNDLVTDLGIDPRLKVTATEAAGAIEMLVKNGTSLDDVLSGAARSTVLLSNSTGGAFATSADVATSAMAQFKIRASEMTGAVNQIVGVTKSSKFDIDDYRLAISQAGGVAASVGVSFEDFNAAIADMAPLFASGSDAGTSFKTFLQKLVPDSEPAKEKLRALGILTRDGTNAFFDASGQMKSMAEIAGILQRATAGLNEEQKISAFTTIFGTDAMRAAFALADGGADSINKLKTTIGNTSAEEAAKTRMDTLKGDWEIFQGILETISIQIGQKFLPNARGVVQWATELATRQGPALVDFFGRIANMMPALGRMALGFFDTISGPGVTKTVEALMNALGSLGKTLVALVRPFRDAFQGLFTELAAMRGVGIVDIFKVIVRRLGVALSEFGSYIRANAIPFVREQFNKFRDQLYTWIRSVNWWEETQKWAAAFWEWAVDLWNWAKPYLEEFWGWLSGWVTDPQKRKQLADAIVTGWNVFTEWAAAVWSWMEPGLTSAWGWLSSWVTDEQKRKLLWDSIVTGWNVFSEWAANVWAWMEPGLTAAWGWLISWVTQPEKRQQLWDGVTTVWNVFADWATAIINWITPGLTSAWSWISSWATDPEKRKLLQNAIVSGWNVFTEWATTIWGWIEPGLTAAWNGISSWVTDPQKRQLLIDTTNQWRSALITWSVNLWEGENGEGGIKKLLDGWWSSFTGWMKTNFPQVSESLSNLGKAFSDFFSALVEFLHTEYEIISGIWKNLWGDTNISWENAIADLIDNIASMMKILTGFIQILDGLAKNEWGPVWAGFKNIATGAWELLTSFLVGTFEYYGGQVRDFLNQFAIDTSGAADIGDKLWKRIRDSVSGVIDAIKGIISGAAIGSALATIITTFNETMGRFKDHVFSVMKDVGQRIIDGITEGIKNGANVLKDALNWVTSAMPDWVRNALGIHSPSTVFAEIGKNISMGLARGIDDNMRLPEISVKRLVKTTVDTPAMGWQPVRAESLGGQQRIDVYVHADTQNALPTNRQALREIVIGLQRELQLSGARVAY